MKTLNKTLSLVLALVMVFSLFGVASAAKLGDFTDKDEITKDYKEAVDYLTAAGIVAGNTATTINPKGDFTREQAAKLVAYACLGQAAADAMKAPKAPFTDVAADRWSAGYIAYCVNAGIINGTGDGTFAPEAKVTGYQMAKMLLGALGYGVNNEFIGTNWKLEVAKYALAKDIFYGNTAGASDADATREEAFLYTFNALTRAMMVKYNSSLEVYYSGTNPFETEAGTTTKYTIGEQRFKMTKTAGTAADSTYGEATHYWAIDGKKVTGVYPNDDIKELANSINGTPYDKLTKKGNTEYIGYNADDTVAYYINGDVKTLADVTTAADVKGNKISFYDTDKNGKYDTVEVLVYHVKKLTSAPVVKTAGGNSVVTIADIGMTNKVDTAITGDFAGLAKGDYVLYYKNDTGSSWTIAKCETLTGQMFGFNEVAGQFNINGTTSSFSEIIKDDGIDFDDVSATKGLANTVFYLDAGKNVVAAAPAEDLVAAANVVFVLTGKDDIGTCVAKMLKSDGTVVTKNIDKVTDTSNNVANAVFTGGTGTVNVSAGKFFTFTENTNGNYNLKAIGTATGAAHQITTPTYDEAKDPVFVKGQAKFFYDGTGSAPAKGTAKATTGTNKTVFVLEGEGTKAGSYTAYTGVSAIPNVDAAATPANTKAYVLNDKDGYAIMAVALGGDLDNSVLSMDYAFIGMTASTVKMSNTADEYYNYPIVTVNGEVKAAGLDATNAGFAPGIMAIDAYDDGKAAGTHVTGAAYIANSSTAQALIDETRIERVIFNLLDPNNEGNKLAAAAPAKDALKANDLKNVTATGFDVVGNTVSFNSVASTDESFVVTDDVKVFYHDCTDALTTGKITLEKQAGIGVLESLPKTAAGTDTYTYGVSALSVSKDDPTINELYVTIYPVKPAAVVPPVDDTPAGTPKAATLSKTAYTIEIADIDGAMTTTSAKNAARAALVAAGYTYASFEGTTVDSDLTITATDGTTFDITSQAYWTITVDDEIVEYVKEIGTSPCTLSAKDVKTAGAGKGSGYTVDGTYAAYTTATTALIADVDAATVIKTGAIQISTGTLGTAAIAGAKSGTVETATATYGATNTQVPNSATAVYVTDKITVTVTMASDTSTLGNSGTVTLGYTGGTGATVTSNTTITGATASAKVVTVSSTFAKAQADGKTITYVIDLANATADLSAITVTAKATTD